MGSWKLFFDGGCNLCHTSKLKAAQWAERSHQPLELEFLQSEEAAEKGYSGDRMVLEADGSVFYGAEAWLKLLELAPWPLRWLAWMDRFAITRWLSRQAYAGVARIRYAVWGRSTCALSAKPPK